jgi:hypothetical protein
MRYVLESLDPGRRVVNLKDDWSGTDHKILQVNDWNGYESDIQVIATDTRAIVTLANGAIKQFDLTHGNVGVEIA